MANRQSVFSTGGRTQLIAPIGEGGGTREECAKLVASFNREVAVYHNLALSLGGSSDCTRLREELKSSRQRACELAHMIKSKLIPLLRSKMRVQENTSTLERLYSLYSGCLELLQIELLKTASLQESFSLATGTTVLINTGVVEPVTSQRTYVSVQQIDQDPSDRLMLEKEEILRLDRAARDVQEMVYSISQTMDIQPWDIEPDIAIDKEYQRSVCSSSDADSGHGLAPVAASPESNTRRKRMFIVVVSLVTVIVCITIVALLVGFLK